MVDVEQRAMVGVQVGAYLGVDARGALAVYCCLLEPLVCLSSRKRKSKNGVLIFTIQTGVRRKVWTLVFFYMTIYPKTQTVFFRPYFLRPKLNPA